MPATLRHLAAASVLFTALAASASAQVLPAGPKKLPDAKTVLGLLGSPESKMFDTFGPPDDVTPQGKKNYCWSAPTTATLRFRFATSS